MGWILDEAGAQLLDEALNPLLAEGIPFPDTALGHTVELNLNGTWTDITGYVHDGQVKIARGHPDESVTVAPSVLDMILTNSDGRFSTKNPVSPYYPYLVRNTPVRVSIPAQLNYLRLETDATSYASCPDAAGLDITGDMDVQLDMKLTNWQPCTLATKWASAASKTWALYLRSDGTIAFEFWDGTSDRAAICSVPLPVQERLAVRATFQASSGTVTFYTASSISGTWTQLGNAVSWGTAVTLSVSAAPVTVGYSSGYIVTDPHAGYSGPNGSIYEFRLYSGIAGTLKANPVFSSQAAGATPFSDAQGNTWTLGGTAEISSRNYRGHFELSELPQHEPPYEPSGGTPDVTVAAVGGGLLRRQSQRSNPVNSAMYRAWAQFSAAPLAAYWPMEDGANATQAASASGGLPMTFGGASSPKMASNSDFTCSSALPVVNSAAFTGNVGYAGTWTDNQVAFLMEIPSGGEANNAQVAAFNTTGTIAELLAVYGTGGSLTLTGYDATGAQVFTSGSVGFAANGQKMLLSMALTNAGGGNITWHIDGFAVGAASPTGASGTVSGTIGAVTRVQLNNATQLASTVMGHCAVLPAYQQLYNLFTYTNPYGLLTGALNAWAGEPAGVRFARICSE